MFLGMQDFDFAQIQSNLPKSITFAQLSLQFCPNFASILPKFHPSLAKLAQI